VDSVSKWEATFTMAAFEADLHDWETLSAHPDPKHKQLLTQ